MGSEISLARIQMRVSLDELVRQGEGYTRKGP